MINGLLNFMILLVFLFTGLTQAKPVEAEAFAWKAQTCRLDLQYFSKLTAFNYLINGQSEYFSMGKNFKRGYSSLDISLDVENLTSEKYNERSSSDAISLNWNGDDFNAYYSYKTQDQLVGFTDLREKYRRLLLLQLNRPVEEIYQDLITDPQALACSLQQTSKWKYHEGVPLKVSPFLMRLGLMNKKNEILSFKQLADAKAPVEEIFTDSFIYEVKLRLNYFLQTKYIGLRNDLKPIKTNDCLKSSLFVCTQSLQTSGVFRVPRQNPIDSLSSQDVEEYLIFDKEVLTLLSFGLKDLFDFSEPLYLMDNLVGDSEAL